MVDRGQQKIIFSSAYFRGGKEDKITYTFTDNQYHCMLTITFLWGIFAPYSAYTMIGCTNQQCLEEQD